MKAQIQITIPSLHALHSARAFNLEHSRETPAGGMKFWQNFETVAEARQHLLDVAMELHNGDPAGNWSKDFCRYDAATAWIVTDKNEFFN